MARAMKDSGIPWIGEIPEDWHLQRMKSCIQSRTSGAWGEEAQGNNGDMICLRIADYDYDKFSFKNTPIENLTIRNYDESVIQKLLLKKGDILIEKSGGGEKTPVGRTVIFDKEYPALYANFMDCLRCSDAVISKWMQYVFVTFYKNDYTRNYIKQTTGIQNLDLTSMLANESVPVPSVIEQKRVADYLDTECARIDAVMEQTRASIEEYKKLKQSVITQAVTKGIRPNRPMKDSGIDWIGQIPAEWDCTTVNRIATVVRGASPRPAGDPRYFNGNDVPWITVAEVTNGDGKFIFTTETYLTAEGANYSRIVEEGTLLLSNSGATLGVPKITKIRGCINDGSLAFYNLQINQDYLLYVFSGRTMELRKQMQGYGQPNLNTTIVKGLWLPLPTNEEQVEIVIFLDNRITEIESLITKKEQFLSEMESYKKSLIFEYVTGKKEVLSC